MKIEPAALVSLREKFMANNRPGGIIYVTKEEMKYMGELGRPDPMEEYVGLYDTWRDRAFKAAGIADWAEAARCFKEVAFYHAIIDWIKRYEKNK